jgi:hypothetical protein
MTDVQELMGGQLADMSFCDAPYNVDYGNSAKGKMSASGSEWSPAMHTGNHQGVGEYVGGTPR